MYMYVCVDTYTYIFIYLKKKKQKSSKSVHLIFHSRVFACVTPYCRYRHPSFFILPQSAKRNFTYRFTYINTYMYVYMFTYCIARFRCVKQIFAKRLTKNLSLGTLAASSSSFALPLLHTFHFVLILFLFIPVSRLFLYLCAYSMCVLFTF